MTDMTLIQAQLVELRTLGWTHARIGERLGISVDTVDYEVKKLRKAGVDLPTRSNGSQGDWTEDRVARLTALWYEDKSAGIIAAEMSREANCRITRNAVIGKLNRLGFNRSGRPTIRVSPLLPSRYKRRAVSLAGGTEVTIMSDRREHNHRPDRAGKAVIVPLPPTESWTPLPGTMGLSLMQLTDKTCRWPIGEPRDKDFGFCGTAPSEGSPYCSYHTRVAYQPAAKRRAA